MSAPLLETKVYVPSPRRGLVPRPRLRALLENGVASRLTLVSAPAGFGKTMLLAEWVASRSALSTGERCVAWLSLDRSDNDPTSFWTYVIASLRTVAPVVGGSEMALLRSPQPPPVSLVLTTLLNDLGAFSNDVVLVLDDYHVIDQHDVHEEMSLLLDHLPPNLHLVIAGRADPPLPLARLRVRGELVEIRAADLRFTRDEATAYLNGAMGLALTTSDVTALEARTEGWIAALQLAALSMQGRDDVAAFIAGFAGDDRYVVDYLAEEVMQRQPERVRSFLLKTSILSRLDGPLCDAVTGDGGGKAMLEALERGNLFVVPLDDRRQRYRYHHLFADVLQARLLDERPEQVRGLHGRASTWCEQNGEQAEAIRHALAADDFNRAADLVETAIPATLRDRQEATLCAWVEALPADVVQVRPVLSNAYAGALLACGQVEGVEARLQDSERWLTEAASTHGGAGTSPTPIVVDQEELRRLPGGIAVHRAGLALARGDRASTVAHARSALELLQENDLLGHGAASALLGLASWADGDLESAHDAYARCTAMMRRAGHLSDVLGCSITLADIRITQGRLHDAMRTYEEALRLVPEQDGSVLRGTADMYVGMSAIHRERDDLETARQLLRRSEELGEANGLPQNRYRWRVAMARLREAEGDLNESLGLLDDAERLYLADFSPDVRPVAALRARAWILQGRYDDALGWAQEHAVSTDDELSYLREFEHVTLARALLARHGGERAGDSLTKATKLLRRLLPMRLRL